MNIHFDIMWQRWPWLCAAVLLLFIAWRMLESPEHLARARRKILFYLRLGLYLILALAIVAPVLTVRWKETVKPLFAVFVDGSSSMATEDAAGQRFLAIARSLETGEWLRAVHARGGTTRFCMFGTRALPKEAAHVDSTDFSQGTTDLSSAYAFLAQTDAEKNGQPLSPAGILLFSDGIFNSGPEPDQVAAEAGVPVYTVTVGDTSEPFDVYVEKAESSPAAVEGRPVQVRVCMGIRGTVGARVRISLEYQGKKLADTAVTFNTAEGLYECVLSARPPRPGEQEWSARVQANFPEKNLKNNRKNFLVIAAPARIKIAALFGEPGFDSRFLLRAIAQDSAISVSALSMVKQEDFSRADPFLSRATADSSKMILVHAFELKRLQQATLAALYDFVKKGGGLALLGNTAGAGLPENCAWVPYKPPFRLYKPDMSAKIVPGDWARSSSIMEANDAGPLAWEQFPVPDVYEPQSLENAIPLLSVQSGTKTTPLLYWSRAGKGKVLVYLGTSLWEMDFGVAGEQALRAGDLWPGWTRWMATPGDAERFHVTLGRREYVQGENLHVSAEVYDRAMRLLDDAEISFELRKNQKAVAAYQLQHMPGSFGLFEAAIPLITTGEYSYYSKAVSNGEPVGAHSGTFMVRDNPLEARKTASQPGVMKKIADATGGKTYTLPEFEKNIADVLPYAPTVRLQQRAFAPCNTLWLALAWIVLFCIDWVLRKKWRVE